MPGSRVRWLLLVPLVGATVAGSAATLDWDTSNWAAGSLSNSYDVDSTHTGNDITLALSGTTTQFNSGYPVNNNSILAGGTGTLGSTAQKSLVLYINAFTSNTQVVTVTMTFNYTNGVYVNFTLFDVDANSGSFVDQVRNIRGITSTGGTVAPTISAAVPANETITSNSVTGKTNVDNSQNGANVTISFTTRVTQVIFDYGNDTTAPNPPAAQAISIFDINFMPTPEVHPAFIAGMACFGLAGWQWYRRRCQRV